VTSPATALVPRTPEPGTALYRHFGDARAMLFGPHALLLQVMHPVVDAGVLQHSNYKTQPFKRLIGTVRSMATIVYGGPDGAAAESRRLRKLHREIKGVDKQGNRYHSLDPEAWAWVYATLVKGSIDAQLRYGRQLKKPLLEEYYRQARELGLVIGIRPQDLPDDWDAFEKYFETTIETKLRETQSGHDVLRFIRQPPAPFFIPDFIWETVTSPIGWVIRLITVATLPETVRERMEIRYQRWEKEIFMWMVAAGKIVSFLTPQFFFYFGTRVVGYLNGRLVLYRERRESKELAATNSPPSSTAPPPSVTSED